MDNLLLPRAFDNHFNGQKLAFWIFWIVVVVRVFQGAYLIVNCHTNVREAEDGIPLESFPIAASNSIVALFAISGSSRLILSLLCVLTFLRYRSMVPLMFVLLTLDQMAKEIVLYFYPLYRVGNPIGPTINLILLFLTVVGFVLSVIKKKSIPHHIALVTANNNR